MIEKLKIAYESGKITKAEYLEMSKIFENKESFTFKNGATVWVNKNQTDHPTTLSFADLVNKIK